MSESETSMEGWAPETADIDAMRDALEKAFDYRGDVTCELEGGEELVGFLFNRDFDATPAWIEVYPAKADAPARRIELQQVRSIRFTGRDTADGRSWEAWVKKWEEKKATGEAEA